jgi:hypothetical protein
MEKKNKLYLVWCQEQEDDVDSGFWNQYTSLEDAVSTEGDSVEVFIATPKRLGKFKRAVKTIRIKTRKKKVKK